jgi:hypothetical protein
MKILTASTDTDVTRHLQRPKKLTAHAISLLPAAHRRYDVSDDVVPSLCITVFPSGKKTWNYRYRLNGKSNRYYIGDAYSILPNRARRKARAIAEDLAKNIDPSQAKCRPKGNRS